MTELEEQFEVVRKLYPGTKRGLGNEYANFIKKGKKPIAGFAKYTAKQIVPLLKDAINYQINYRKWAVGKDIWIPQWKNFQTWVNNQCWEEEHPDFDDVLLDSEHEEETNEVGTHAISESEAKSFWD